MDGALFSLGFVALLSFALWLATRIADVEETSFVRAIVAAIIMGIITLIIRTFIDFQVYWIVLNLALFIVVIKIVYKAELRNIAMILFWTGGIISAVLIAISFIARALASKPGG